MFGRESGNVAVLQGNKAVIDRIFFGTRRSILRHHSNFRKNKEFYPRRIGEIQRSAAGIRVRPCGRSLIWLGHGDSQLNNSAPYSAGLLVQVSLSLKTLQTPSFCRSTVWFGFLLCSGFTKRSIFSIPILNLRINGQSFLTRIRCLADGQRWK